MKTNIFKITLVLVCALVVSVFTSCNADVYDQYGRKIEFHTEVEKKGPQFLEGHITTGFYNEPVYLDELVEEYVGQSFEIKITGPNNYSKKFTRLRIWTPEEPGTYQITYTVPEGEHKGTVSIDFIVESQKIKWEYTLPNEAINLNEEFVFADYYGKMNSYVDSYYATKFIMDKIVIGEETIDTSNLDKITVSSMEDHECYFHIEALDGQTVSGKEIIKVKNVDKAYAASLTQQNITTKGELVLCEDYITLNKGTYANGSSTAAIKYSSTPHILPYVAFNGDYDFDDIVMCDFTGNNMPYISFFRGDDYSQSIFDGTKGILIANGWIKNDGKYFSDVMCGRITCYGPNMLRYHDQEGYASDLHITSRLFTMNNAGDTSAAGAAPYAGSMRTLADGVHYRVICGFTKCTGFHDDGTAKIITFRMVVINLDTMEVVADVSKDTYDIKSRGEGYYDCKEDYFTGNIVLYGRYGVTTTLDEIYPIITDKSIDDVLNSFEHSELNSDIKDVINKGTTVNVSTFVTNPISGYKLTLTDSQGIVTDITDGMKLDTVGEYTLSFVEPGKYAVKKTLSVIDMDATTAQWLDDNNVSISMLTSVAANNSFIFSKGTGDSFEYGNPSSLGYIAFNGDYGVNDFVVCDFVGKNMPYITFLRDAYTNSATDGSQGILVSNGATHANGTLWGGATDGRITVYGPYMLEKADNDGSVSTRLMFDKTNSDHAPGSALQLVDGVNYRVICGITGFSGEPQFKQVSMAWAFINLDTGEVMETFTVTSDAYHLYMSNNYIWDLTDYKTSGSIVLYGKLGTNTEISHLYSIEEDTNFAAVVAKYTPAK